ncbi:MAG TPA: hypothetical protein VHT24_10540 [Pseudacidobacterium sp.]|nr:hypothetical protein [Pseudacidobacterium sp.]
MLSRLLSAFVLFFTVLALVAQESSTSPTPASNSMNGKFLPAPQEQFAPYWTTEGGWHSELQMRNNTAGRSLTVTPVLRDHTGTEYPLAPVTIAPNEIKSVDVAEAVASSAPQLIGSYGSVGFPLQLSRIQKSLCGSHDS